MTAQLCEDLRDFKVLPIGKETETFPTVWNVSVKESIFALE